MQKRVLDNPKINILYNTVITSLHPSSDGKSIEKITIHNNNELSQLNVDGLFYGLGLTPNSALFSGKILTDNEGYIQKRPLQEYDTPYETMTSVPGVFVAGDVSDKIYRQAVVACGDGCKAALDANNYINFISENEQANSTSQQSQIIKETGIGDHILSIVNNAFFVNI
jgi:thioredoxin reductase (NADPH)